VRYALFVAKALDMMPCVEFKTIEQTKGVFNATVNG
jgi:hypothetical protein